MEQGARKIMAGAAVSVLVLAGEYAGAGERGTPTFVIYVSDQAHTEPGVLLEAQAQADRIFRDAGVRAVWREAKDGVYNPGCDGFSVLVTLLSPVMVRRLSLQGMSEKALGSAASAAGRASIHPERIHAFAARTRTRAGEVMGKVMAHEIGHLLLPEGHAHYGLMTAGMHADPGASARFTAPQARAIRKLVEARTGAFARGAECAG